ncbi:MAG: CHAD domain-containing protein [Campylobacterota bacterium]
MKNELLSKKLEEFKIYITRFIVKQKSSVKSIHSLRVNGRELLSLVSADDSFSTELKKVIKQSNKIRDMDVFIQAYLGSLPKKYILKLDIKTIKKSIKKKRKKKIKKLRLYLKSLVIPHSAEFERNVRNKSLKSRKIETLNQEELHKYRIYIKKRLYNEKNSTPFDEKRVEVLTKIKDLLGEINDNYNGLKRLKRFAVKHKLFKEIQDFTNLENLRIFKEFKDIEDEYGYAL